jgi:hypothetical protein
METPLDPARRGLFNGHADAALCQFACLDRGRAKRAMRFEASVSHFFAGAL